MTEKQNVPFDEQVRRTLDALPDTPPPSSTFDSGRLWEQLRPELAQLSSHSVQAQSRWQPGRWWLAAAALAGLLLSWLVWFQPHESRVTPGLSLNPKPVSKPSMQPVRQPELASIVVAKPKPIAQGTMLKSLSTFHKSEKNQDDNALVSQATSQQIIPETTPTEPLTFQQPTPSPAEAIAAVPEPTTVAEGRANKVVNVSKNRWRVVHQNELPALDEAYQVRYRSAQYGRSGTGNQIPALESAENLPLFSIPLSRKSIQ